MQSAHSIQSINSAAPLTAREIPLQLQRVRAAINELSGCTDVLLARTASVRRIPAPQAEASAAPTSAPGHIRPIPQTPIGTTLEEMVRDLEQQIRSVNHAIDTLELS